VLPKKGPLLVLILQNVIQFREASPGFHPTCTKFRHRIQGPAFDRSSRANRPFGAKAQLQGGKHLMVDESDFEREQWRVYFGVWRIERQFLAN
jgi:hypothetical protein